MKDTLEELRSVVLEVEEQSLKNQSTKFWLMQIKDIAYDADGLVDDWELLRMKSRKKVCNCLPLYWHRSAAKMTGLLSRFEEVGSKYHLFDASKSVEKSPSFNVNAQSSSFVSDESVYGRYEDKEKILVMLFGSYHQDLNVIPVVGMGGIGKTTLAQLVYNDDRVKAHFNLTIWVTVGVEFDLVRIAEAILCDSTGRSQKLSNMDALETAVRDVLRGSRFLCVLDDVWSQNHSQWEILRGWFSAGASGSAVILTTRNISIASFMTRGSIYCLEPLSEEVCWSIFGSLAFGYMTPKAELEEIGKQIVRRCGGLPLAIKTLGGLMRYKTQVHEWLSIMNNDIWDNSDILAVLKLSYDHLPAHLKQCFAYCSVFPKDYAFNREKLIRLWIAEGFVESTFGEELEDVADEYFVELLHRSFFQDRMTDPNGITVEYQMHDLMHDLAQCVVGVESAIVEEKDSLHVSEKVRRISLVHESGSSKIPERVYGAKKLRTLFSFSGKFERIPLPFLNLRYLRVLGLSQRGIHELPDTIGTLNHLRYLDLSHTYIKSIPESIGKLKYLQTLELSECYNLVALPKAICLLTNLRHLDIRSCSLIHMPSGIGKLSFLQNLPAFILGKQANCAELIELRGLNLRGRLDIKNLENVINSAHAREAGLLQKLRLRSLGLSWGRNAHLAAAALSFEVLEGLVPPRGLEVLDITGYNGKVFPSWIASCLSNVVKVSLINCSCQQLPPLGMLPFLRDLFIKGMPAVCSISYDFYKNCNDIAFPALRQLELYDMPNLLEWKLDEKVESFPCLDTLTVKGCSKLTGLPSIPHLSNLALWHSDELLLASLAHLTSLSTLALNGLRDPKVFPWDMGSLNYIKQLTMYDCDNLESLFEDMRGFSSLQQLSILYCHKLESLPVGLRYLDSLKRLDIVGCEQLADILDIMHCLSSLEELIIEGCPMLRSFLYTDKPIRLQKLVIKGCPQLKINSGDFITEEDILWESDTREAHIPRT
ncbi:putative disease resistance protein RGA3 isoform X2 [Prunus dulcis]|nr:putative disease resistance protein RGA3 isoform X2 [Prunus dulcis]